jgi:glucokinase
MNPTAIGIDFGGTTVKFGVVQDGRILARMPVLVTRDYPDHELLLKAIRKTIEELREHNSEVAAVGAGLPGMIDSVNGRVYQLSNVPGW